MKPANKRLLHMVPALLLPFVSCWVQWQFWAYLKPFVWFLFFPTVFFSSRIGGKMAGMVSTVVSTTLVMYFFISPQLSFSVANPHNLYSVAVFVCMGLLFSYTHDRLERTSQRAMEALESSRIAAEQLQEATIGRLQAEQQLAQNNMLRSEERFRRLFTTAPVPLCYVTGEGALADINERFVQTFGYTQADVPTAAEWFCRAYPEEQYRHEVLAAWEKAVAKAAEEGRDIDPIEYRVTCKDGSELIMLISGIVLEKDMLVTFFDVTERRRTEEALRQSEASLKQAQHLAKVGNWSWDTVRGIHLWSEEIYRIYGRDLHLPPALYPEVAGYFTPESWSRLAAAVETALATGHPYQCDAQVLRPDGGTCWIVARGAAEQDSSGNVVRLYGTVQDITERKLAEEEICKLNASLEQRVEERTAELVAANRELDAFAYAVSHDLRAPLRAMIGFSQALVEDYGGQLQGEALVYLEQITLASRQMGELIEGMLTLSRSIRGDLYRDLLDLSHMAQQIRGELARQEPERQVEWQITPGLTVRGDRRMLESVMRNLLGNAWKYTSRTPSPCIRVFRGEVEGRPAICIADNGAGFHMSHVPQLFQPFRRLHRQDEFPGIGIGLATVQRIIQRHGGTIQAQGAVGEGATFCFTLPANMSQGQPQL